MPSHKNSALHQRLNSAITAMVSVDDHCCRLKTDLFMTLVDSLASSRHSDPDSLALDIRAR